MYNKTTQKNGKATTKKVEKLRKQTYNKRKNDVTRLGRNFLLDFELVKEAEKKFGNLFAKLSAQVVFL